MKARFFLVMYLALTALSALSAPRTTHEMRAAAVKALRQHPGRDRVVARNEDYIGLLGSYHHLFFYGFSDGGYAIVSDDDLLPPVLAIVPDSPCRLPQGANRPEGLVGTTANDINADEQLSPGLSWWLEATAEAVAKVKQSGVRHTPSLPSVKKHPASVEPLLETRWGQLPPFNDLCPMRNGERTVTGCVATSMAQVLYYHRYPATGCGGEASVTVPAGDPDGQVYTVDYEQLSFDYDQMLPYYGDGYTQEQGQAVATLMYACGVAANMNYDVEAVGGSGTLSLFAQQALNKHFGFEDVKFLCRDGLSDRRFMDMVYTELAAHRPIIHGGQGLQGGHSFVLCGYNEQGLIYVNWGWNGQSNGYYDIDLLNPRTYSFADQQDMVYNIKTVDYEEPSAIVSLAEPGTLASLLPYQIDNGLKVIGPVNSTDLRTLRGVLGCDDHGVYSESPRLNLDLSEARIVSGGEPYLIEGTKRYTTTDDEIPYKAFYNCQSLRRMKLPRDVVAIGDGAWGNCVSLWTVDDNDAPDKQFLIDNDYIYNIDRTELIAALPVERIEVDSLFLPEGITTIRPYAFSGYQELTYVDLPRSLTSIGAGAFLNSTAIQSIKLRGKELPTLGKDVFAGMVGGCTLYLWGGLKNTALRKSQWKDFKSIVEFGTTITATNTSRNRWEPNPEFGYSVAGEPVQGTPELVCDAMPGSPAGVYAIHCLPGTITSQDVDYVDGRLIVFDPTPSSISLEAADRDGSGNPTAHHPLTIYDLQGRLVTRENEDKAMQGLENSGHFAPMIKKGVYIMNGKTVIWK